MYAGKPLSMCCILAHACVVVSLCVCKHVCMSGGGYGVTVGCWGTVVCQQRES